MDFRIADTVANCRKNFASAEQKFGHAQVSEAKPIPHFVFRPIGPQ